MKKKILCICVLITIIVGLLCVPIGATNEYYETVVEPIYIETVSQSYSKPVIIHVYTTYGLNSDERYAIEVAINSDPENNKSNIYIDLTDNAIFSNDVINNLNSKYSNNLFYYWESENLADNKYRNWGMHPISNYTSKINENISTTYLAFIYRYSNSLSVYNGDGYGYTTFACPCIRLTVTPRGDASSNPYVRQLSSGYYMHFRFNCVRVAYSYSQVNELQTQNASLMAENRLLGDMITDLSFQLEEANEYIRRELTELEQKTFLGQTFYGLMGGFTFFVRDMFSLGWGNFTIGSIFTLVILSVLAYWLVKNTFL